MNDHAPAAAGPYTRHLDVLVALISQLAINPKWSRTLEFLARDLSLPEDQIRATLTEFGSLFREHNGYYSLHARAALRTENDTASELRADILKVLLEYVLNRSAAESSQAQFEQNLKNASRNTKIAAIAAPIAAFASILAAVLTVAFGH